MNGKRSKWIRLIVESRHPKVLEMITEKFGKEKSEKMTYKQVIKACKKMWEEKTPGIEEWKIYKKVEEK